jgi:hypothetical protein
MTSFFAQLLYFAAFYYPPGNLIGEFHENVLPPMDESKQDKRHGSINSVNK